MAWERVRTWERVLPALIFVILDVKFTSNLILFIVVLPHFIAIHQVSDNSFFVWDWLAATFTWRCETDLWEGEIQQPGQINSQGLSPAGETCQEDLPYFLGLHKFKGGVKLHHPCQLSIQQVPLINFFPGFKTGKGTTCTSDTDIDPTDLTQVKQRLAAERVKKGLPSNNGKPTQWQRLTTSTTTATTGLATTKPHDF